MGTTTPSQDRAPAWLPTAEIPLQRQAPPLEVVPVALPAPRIPAAPPRARQHWPVAVSVIAAGLAVGAIGVMQAATTDTAPPAAASGGFVANVSVPGRVLTSVGDGTWQIGVDVEPGTYTTSGAVDSTCHHALRPTRTGGGVVDATDGLGPATVVLAEADGWFETSGCATWRRVG